VIKNNTQKEGEKMTVKYNFTNDLMFKEALKRCPKGAIKLVKEFVPDLKDIDINEKVIFLKEQNILSLDISTTIFDVNLQIANNLIELEMQNQDREYTMQNRMLKYIADMINNSYEKDKDYEHKPCYSVWFLGFRLFNDENSYHSFEFYDKENNISLVNDTKVICVEFAKFTELDYNNKWYKLFKTYDLNSLKGDDLIMNELVDNIKNLNEDEEFVLKIDAKEKAEREQRAHYEGSMRKARKEGLEQGLEQGEKNKAIEIAKNLKASGMSLNDVSKFTGLSKEEIESL
jgi:predicted transposase/invertase (TIGR01784 family)